MTPALIVVPFRVWPLKLTRTYQKGNRVGRHMFNPGNWYHGSTLMPFGLLNQDDPVTNAGVAEALCLRILPHDVDAGKAFVVAPHFALVAQDSTPVTPFSFSPFPRHTAQTNQHTLALNPGDPFVLMPCEENKLPLGGSGHERLDLIAMLATLEITPSQITVLDTVVPRAPFRPRPSY